MQHAGGLALSFYYQMIFQWPRSIRSGTTHVKLNNGPRGGLKIYLVYCTGASLFVAVFMKIGDDPLPIFPGQGGESICF